MFLAIVIIIYLVLILFPLGIMKITKRVIYGLIYSILLFIFFTYSLNGSGIPHNYLDLNDAFKISAVFSLPAFISTVVSIFVAKDKEQAKLDINESNEGR